MAEVPVRIVATCFGATFIGVSWSFCSKIVRVGASFWIWGVFLRGFLRGVFHYFRVSFLASALGNVVYFAFLGVIGEHGFFGGGEKRGTFEYAFCFGFRGLFRFSTSFHETTIFIGFRVVTGF